MIRDHFLRHFRIEIPFVAQPRTIAELPLQTLDCQGLSVNGVCLAVHYPFGGEEGHFPLVAVNANPRGKDNEQQEKERETALEGCR